MDWTYALHYRSPDRVFILGIGGMRDLCGPSLFHGHIIPFHGNLGDFVPSGPISLILESGMIGIKFNENVPANYLYRRVRLVCLFTNSFIRSMHRISLSTQLR